MRRDGYRRLVVRSIVALVLGGGALALALGMGLPDPGAAERAFAGLAGALGLILAWSWLREWGMWASEGRDGGEIAPDQGLSGLAPSIEAAGSLERAIGFGTSTRGSFDQMVRPRLRALAEAKLARMGYSIEDDVAGRRLLGDAWPLVGQRRPSTSDPLEPGVPLPDIARLVDLLERLP